jgi:AraC-like DNA-binding protein
MTAARTNGARFRFTRNDVLSSDGLAIWRKVVGRAILSVDLAVLPDFPFHSSGSTRAQPEFRVALLFQSGLRIERTRDLLTDGVDDFVLQICTAGTLIVSQRAQEIVLHRGDATLLSAAEAVSIACPSPTRFVHVQLPRKALALLVPGFDDAIMRPIPRDSRPLQLLAGYARMVGADQSMISPDFSRLVATHLHDLVAASLGAARDAALADEGGIRTARLHAIKADITERLADHDLSVASVAARQYVTPRYVQALFEREGTTFSAFVLAQRLARARSLLADPRNANRPINAIAGEAGFCDRSHFNRGFRQRYGVAPSDIRATVLRKG